MKIIIYKSSLLPKLNKYTSTYFPLLRFSLWKIHSEKRISYIFLFCAHKIYFIFFLCLPLPHVHSLLCVWKLNLFQIKKYLNGQSI